jgi:HPt (histidine-containing phosphotransfer) domain-containing protein
MPDSCPLDLKRLDEISGGDQELEQELMDEFLRGSPRLLLSLEDAVAVADAQCLCRSARLLKKAAGSVAALELAEVCRELERVSQRRVPGGADELVAEIRTLFTEIVDFAQDHFLMPVLI